MISWTIESDTVYSNCIDCYFNIRKALQDLEQKYLEKYKVIPEFKAGAHFGSVVAGEIGVIKRDITYSGDILNTCARIQGECNKLDSRFLISQDLFEKLNPISSDIESTPKGEIKLKGKEFPLELFSIA